jgi:hypothetical protein
MDEIEKLRGLHGGGQKQDRRHDDPSADSRDLPKHDFRYAARSFGQLLVFAASDRVDESVTDLFLC